MSSFVKVSGGTGVFHPRVSNTTTTTTNNATGDVKKKQGESDIPSFVQVSAFLFWLCFVMVLDLGFVQIGVYSSNSFVYIVYLCFS